MDFEKTEKIFSANNEKGTKKRGLFDYSSYAGLFD